MSDGRDQLERWVGGALSAASFAAIVQLSTLPTPSPGSALLWAARCFAAALPLALLAITLSLFQTGGKVRRMHPRWKKFLETLASCSVVAAGVSSAGGAACLTSHVIAPGDPWAWPTWLFIALFLVVLGLGLFLDGADWLDTYRQRRRLKAKQ